MERIPSEMNPDELVDEALRLSELRQQPYLSLERKEQVYHRLEHIIFEYRYQQGDFDDLLQVSI